MQPSMWLVFALTIMCCVLGCASQPPATGAAGKSSVAIPTRVGDERAVLKYIASALVRGSQVGCRLYYHGPYQAVSPSGFHLPGVGFPPVVVRPPPRGSAGLAAVRAIFRGDKNVVVMQGRHGMIRVYIGRVSPAILQTKLRSLKFSPDARYSGSLAIMAITGSAAVVAATHRYSFRNDRHILDVITSGPGPGEPHLPPMILDQTVDQSLDRVARVFGDIVIYGDCTAPDGAHLFDVRCSAVVQPE